MLTFGPFGCQSSYYRLRETCGCSELPTVAHLDAFCVTGPAFGAPGTSLDSLGAIVSMHSTSPLRALLRCDPVVPTSKSDTIHHLTVLTIISVSIRSASLPKASLHRLIQRPTSTLQSCTEATPPLKVSQRTIILWMVPRLQRQIECSVSTCYSDEATIGHAFVPPLSLLYSSHPRQPALGHFGLENCGHTAPPSPSSFPFRRLIQPTFQFYLSAFIPSHRLEYLQLP